MIKLDRDKTHLSIINIYWLFGTTVVGAFFDASGFLSLAQAWGIVAFTEFLGAYLLRADTAATYKDGIIKVELFANKPELLMLGMFCDLIGLATWTMVATRAGWPVYTTHAIVGAVIGVGNSGFGIHSVRFDMKGVSKIAAFVVSLIFLVTKYSLLKYGNLFERGSLCCLC